MTAVFEHRVMFERGHDCMRFECAHGSDKCAPNRGGSHGVHGLQIRFVVLRDDKAVHLVLFTDWLPETDRDRFAPSRFAPIPAEIGYHSPVPLNDEQNKKDCDLLSCRFCYGDSQYTGGPDSAFLSLVNGGDKGVWDFLDQYWLYTFDNPDGDVDFPVKFEYPFQRRGEKP